MPEALQIEPINPQSEELQEIVGKPPGGIARWGMLVISFVLVILLMVSYFVKHVDVLNGDVILTASDAPKSVISKKDGKLDVLLVKDNDSVRADQVLGWLECTASPQVALKLSNDLEMLRDVVQNNQWQRVLEHNPASYRGLGELQSAYQSFSITFMQLKAYLQDGIYIKQRRLLQKELKDLNNLQASIKSQGRVYEQDYLIAQVDFQARKELFNEKVTPLLEFKQEESKLLNKQLPIENIRSTLINNHISISNKEYALIQLDQQFNDQKSTFIQALNTLISSVDEWKRGFLLIAPVSGKIVMPKLIQQKQDVKMNQELFFVSPVTSTCYGEVSVSQEKFGKLQIGQDVLISLSSYPYQEFGKLKGKVSFISNIPDKDMRYNIGVSLPNGLKSDQGKQVQFKNGLAGSAEIITEKTRLINKFFYTIIEIINKPKKPSSK